MHCEVETPESEAADLPANHRRRLNLLSRIYLEAGLPLELAVQSAVADSALFEEDLPCA
jgi:hypothetical protein